MVKQNMLRTPKEIPSAESKISNGAKMRHSTKELGKAHAGRPA
jgi:hypothetical protein